MHINRTSIDLDGAGALFEMDHLYPENDPRRKIVEQQNLDCIPFESERQALHRVLTETNAGAYTPSEEFDPPAGWIRDVHYWITQALHLDDWSLVRVQPTLTTSADKSAGTDFVIRYTDDETKREILVTVDISLKNKSHFKADILVTPIGGKTNETFLSGEEVILPDKEKMSQAEQDALDGERRRRIGELIAGVIKEKLSYESDPHYGDLFNRVRKSTRTSLRSLLQRGSSPEGRPNRRK